MRKKVSHGFLPPAEARTPPGATPAPAEGRLLMAIDPETREALRLGETPVERGPAFFTSLEALEAFCEATDLTHLEPYEVPGSLLTHMAGKPFWLDGKPGGDSKAGQRPAQGREGR